ncbi:MAG: 2OG-Fe(II) oxygenase [Alphaproteobacteria bacterium]|nr:2OG-Fe(II) oxygenase [Alphaproteobacteria bacterium]
MTGQTQHDEIARRLGALDWARVTADLDETGHARIGGLLDPAICETLAALYDRPEVFRSRIVMRKHGFGSGEYQYFAYPLPDMVARLRLLLYSRLATIANEWSARLGDPARYPARLADFLARCHAAGQRRPTPLMLRYRTGDYNRLHQDLYGPLNFPMQVVVLLSRPGIDFTGGELVLTEQKPRMQTRAQVVPLSQGDAAIFAVNARPAPGPRGYHRLTMRHGVSQVESGIRHTLGLIFHDAA